MNTRLAGAAARPGRVRLAAGAALALACAHAAATEGGGNSYPVGVETNYNGMMLPEGLHPFLYYQYYSASHFKDDGGHDNRQFANFALQINSIAARLSYVWPGVRVFGANVETRLVQPVAVADLDLAVARPAPLGPLDRGGDAFGLCDTAFTPVILGWHFGAYHQTVGVDTHLPLGTYDVSERVNTGRNYWQFAPFVAFTWFPAPAFDINAKFRYAFNTINPATDYHSGDEATVEFSAGYRPVTRFQFGVNGYVYRQTTDDRQHDAVVANGNRGRVNALGPYLSYNITPTMPLILKAQFEFGAYNRPQGTRLWLQLKVPL